MARAEMLVCPSRRRCHAAAHRHHPPRHVVHRAHAFLSCPRNQNRPTERCPRRPTGVTTESNSCSSECKFSFLPEKEPNHHNHATHTRYVHVFTLPPCCCGGPVTSINVTATEQKPEGKHKPRRGGMLAESWGRRGYGVVA